MAKFGINDILNAKTKAAGQQAQGYKEIYLSPYEVKAAEENTHQKLDGIEELADSFLHVGQEQPTVLARVNGEYRIIDGHRRNEANKLNLERGHKEYEKVLFRSKDMSEAMYELSLLAGNGYTQELTAYEKTRLVERTKAALIRAKKEDGLEIKGKMRDLIASMLNESSTNVARMESINNNATPEIKEQLKSGSIGVTAAYEAAKLSEAEQKEIAEQAAAGKEIRANEIAQKVAEKKAAEKADKPEEPRPGDDYEIAHPESITSLCYSCLYYSDCNVKTGTCQKCDKYQNKAEAEKTDEQRYSEEQDRIDRRKNGNRIAGAYRKGGAAVRLETIIDRAKALGLPLAKDAFRETKENPLPVPPYLVYIVPQVVGRGSDERILLHEIHAALELYTDKVADGSLEKEIEEKVLFDVDYTKYQDTIESEDMVQTAYEFTIYEKVRKKG